MLSVYRVQKQEYAISRCQAVFNVEKAERIAQWHLLDV